MKTFIFAAKNSSITVTVSAEDEEDAINQIAEYFEVDHGAEYLRLDKEEDEDEQD